MVIHKLSNLTGKMSYKEAIKHKSCANHLGQLKLLMTEIHFLSKYYKDGMLVLYIGAAEGYHIKKLIDMFPGIHFDLWDPLKFSITDTENIKINNKFFTDEDAVRYSNNGKNMIFISDIRNAPPNIKNTDRNYDIEFEKTANEDMKRQLKWVRIMKPSAISLKFRLPFTGKMEYLHGDIWLQSYSPASTEMRLFTSATDNYEKIMTYDCDDVDSRLAYFNYVIRCNGCDKWKEIMKINKIKNNWDNCYCFDILAHYLKTRNKKVTGNNVVKIFLEIIEFLEKRYGGKYNVLFV